MIFQTPDTIETGTLLLRPVEAADAQVLFDTIYGDADVTRYVTFARHLGVEDTAAFIETSRRNTELGAGRCWVVTQKGDGAVLGTIELGMQSMPMVEIGVATCRRGPRHRIGMVHAGRQVVEWLLAQRSVMAIYATCAVNNVSHGLTERLGFTRHSVLPSFKSQPQLGPDKVDHYFYLRSKMSMPAAGSRASSYGLRRSMAARAAAPLPAAASAAA